MDLLTKQRQWRSYNPLKRIKDKNNLSIAEMAGLLSCSTAWAKELLAGTATMSADHFARMERAGFNKLRKDYESWQESKPA